MNSEGGRLSWGGLSCRGCMAGACEQGHRRLFLCDSKRAAAGLGGRDRETACFTPPLRGGGEEGKEGVGCMRKRSTEDCT